MAISYIQLDTLSQSDLPIIGMVANSITPNSLKQAKLEVAGLYAGDPVSVLVAKTGQSIGGSNKGYNPNSQFINAKGSTIAPNGKGVSDVCGFLTFSTTDRVTDGGVPTPTQGDLVLYAPLGEGALMWLEVASQNQAEFQKDLDANVEITIDAINGGVKVAGQGDALKGVKVIQGLTKCRKVTAQGLVSAVGILVQFN